MFECSCSIYCAPRSITITGSCEEAALSRYSSGLPFTVWRSTGKSFRMRSTSQSGRRLAVIGISSTMLVAISTSHRGHEHHLRRLQSVLKWIENESKFLECYDSEQRRISFLP